MIACSGAKRTGGAARADGPSILDHLPNDVADELRQARQTVAVRASIDERMLLPAKERYIGAFYKAAEHALSYRDNREHHVIILSGGYGLLQADEPIGIYDAVFRPAWWPRGLVQRVLLAYAKRHDLAHVRAFVAASTAYRRVMESVSWHGSDIEDAILVSPIMRGGSYAGNWVMTE